MENDTALPISIHDIAPTPNAVRLNGERPDGLPDGTHTGGAWLTPDGLVYKPLDGRPFPNCEHHYPTQEDKCLEFMAGRPFFPRNWRVETLNDRRFLVRRKAFVYGSDDLPLKEARKHALGLEQAVRELNARHWEVGDALSLALDPDSYEPFILDLSTAHEQRGVGCNQADEEYRILKFFEQVGLLTLKRLRERACHVLSTQNLAEDFRGFRYVYASFYRPISLMWATLPNCKLVHEDHANWPEAVPHTWVITQAPLPEPLPYELEWGWSPIHDE